MTNGSCRMRFTQCSLAGFALHWQRFASSPSPTDRRSIPTSSWSRRATARLFLPSASDLCRAAPASIAAIPLRRAVALKDVAPSAHRIPPIPCHGGAFPLRRQRILTFVPENLGFPNTTPVVVAPSLRFACSIPVVGAAPCRCEIADGPAHYPAEFPILRISDPLSTSLPAEWVLSHTRDSCSRDRRAGFAP